MCVWEQHWVIHLWYIYVCMLHVQPYDIGNVILPLVVARDLAVVVAVAITRTEREVGIRNEALVIETAAGKGDDE